jgi:hypothetical protein
VDSRYTLLPRGINRANLDVLILPEDDRFQVPSSFMIYSRQSNGSVFGPLHIYCLYCYCFFKPGTLS